MNRQIGHFAKYYLLSSDSTSMLSFSVDLNTWLNVYACKYIKTAWADSTTFLRNSHNNL